MPQGVGVQIPLGPPIKIMNLQEIIDSEGSWCFLDGCKGTMQWTREIGSSCSCHINPPCQACVDMKIVCTSCSFVPQDEDEFALQKDFNVLSLCLEI